MSRHGRWLRMAVSGVIGMAFITACRAQPKPPTTVTVTRIVVETAEPQTIFVEAPAEPEETATSEPEPQKNLVVCTTQEPVSLYPLATTLPVETAVLHALYENNFTTLSYEIQAQGLTAVPSLADGQAQLRPVEVQAGDLVVDAAGNVTSLAVGDTLINAAGETAVFDGTPLLLNQLVVDFAMKERSWSDGQPVTAADSVYSFQLDADPDTPTSKYVTSRTASYEATGELTTRWTGLPGFRDVDYALRFWRPLPRHLWESYTAVELLSADITNHNPVGDGPFMMADWAAGEYIRLEPNPFYYRVNEGLPYLDSVMFRFISDTDKLVGALLTGECDIVTPQDLDLSQVPLLLAAETNGLIRPYFSPGTVYEHIDFGINSWGRYGDGALRPDWFQDVRVRQAIAMCTDREGMMADILYGRSQLMHSYIPDIHPLYPNDLTQWPYDPAAANALLDAVGYVDLNGDGIRQDPASDQSFRITIGTGDSQMQQQIAQYFSDNLRDCGIIVDSYYLRAEDWYASGPDGPLFGRQFDLGEFAWQSGREPSCFTYASWEITGPETEINPATRQPYIGWDGTNATGWWNPDYDTACRLADLSLPGLPAYEQQHQAAQRIFAQQLPSLPLFLRLNVAATQPDVLNFQMDPTQPSSLWNLYEVDIQN
ncbi:MAG: ABC transporter substrate-binding protein [Anaerolineae bacterium]